jgi:hypothetical protein
MFQARPSQKKIQPVEVAVGDWAAWKLRSKNWRRFGMGALMPAFHGDRKAVLAAAESQLSAGTMMLVFEVKAVLCGSLTWTKVDDTRWISNSPLFIYNPPDAAQIWYLMKPADLILGEFTGVQAAMEAGDRIHRQDTLRNLGHGPRTRMVN